MNTHSIADMLDSGQPVPPSAVRGLLRQVSRLSMEAAQREREQGMLECELATARAKVEMYEQPLAWQA